MYNSAPLIPQHTYTYWELIYCCVLCLIHCCMF